jgi:hypothetical protein
MHGLRCPCFGGILAPTPQYCFIAMVMQLLLTTSCAGSMTTLIERDHIRSVKHPFRVGGDLEHVM